MRVWDLPAGYLNRQSLLGEHRELHGIHSILTQNKTGYASHPETLRWVRTLSGLAMRHRQLAAEMSLRGYVDRTPIRVTMSRAKWPGVFVTEPADQITLLRGKYVGKEKGRIPLPRSAQELWHITSTGDGAEPRELSDDGSSGGAHATWRCFVVAHQGSRLDSSRHTE